MKVLKKIIIAALVFGIFYSCEDSETIAIVKNGTLMDYPDKTLGEAVDDFFGNPYWYSGVSEDGITFVNVEGTIMFMDKNVDALLQYTISADKSTFEFSALEINEVPQAMIIYLGLVEAMYEQ